MLEKPNAATTIGVHFQEGTLAAASLTIKGGKPALEHLFFLEGKEESQSLSRELKRQLVVSAIPTEHCLVRPLDVKLKKDRDVEAVLPFQVEPLLPYPTEEGIFDWIKLAQDNEGTKLTVVAVKKEHLKAHLESALARGIDPEVVSAAPAALAAFAAFFIESKEAHFVVDVGSSSTTCALVHRGKLLAAQSCALGGADLSSLEFDQLSKEVMKRLYSLGKQVKSEGPQKLLVTGRGAEREGFREALSERVEKELLDIIERPNFAVQENELLSHALALGLALTALPKAYEQINFRQGEFAYPNPWKRLKKPVAVYFVSAFLLAFAMHIFGQAYLGYQEDRMKEKYGALLGTMHKPYAQFESEYESKHPAERSGEDGEIIPLKELDNGEIFARLEQLEKEVKNAPDPVALFPNVPRVSDVLAWLSTHPNMTPISADGETAPIQIENFSYAMVQRPEEKKKSNRYQVKVELEFSSTTPKIAREFHDSLITPNHIVDPKGEVKWSSSRGKYRTSFMLRDKTVYPSQFREGDE